MDFDDVVDLKVCVDCGVVFMPPKPIIKAIGVDCCIRCIEAREAKKR